MFHSYFFGSLTLSIVRYAIGQLHYSSKCNRVKLKMLCNYSNAIYRRVDCTDCPQTSERDEVYIETMLRSANKFVHIYCAFSIHNIGPIELIALNFNSLHQHFFLFSYSNSSRSSKRERKYPSLKQRQRATITKLENYHINWIAVCSLRKKCKPQTKLQYTGKDNFKTRWKIDFELDEQNKWKYIHKICNLVSSTEFDVWCTKFLVSFFQFFLFFIWFNSQKSLNALYPQSAENMLKTIQYSYDIMSRIRFKTLFRLVFHRPCV